jgi:hypothetical protein
MGGVGQRAWKGARDNADLQPEEPKVGLISGLERVIGNSSDSRAAGPKSGLVNGLKECKREKQLTDCRSEGGLGQRA